MSGPTGSAQTEGAGKFTTREVDGIWWLADPQGNLLFSRGVCCVNTGASWEDYTAENPGYAAWQHFTHAGDWARSTVDSLKAWGFNTFGGWSDIPLFKRSGTLDLPFTVVLHCGSSAGAPWFDMWDPDIIKRVDAVAREEILKTGDHPLLVGYYSDNELGWWNAPLFKMTWDHQPTSGARTRLLRLVRERYRDSWSDMLKDFDPEGAAGFEELAAGGRLFLRPGGDGIAVVKQFVSMIARRYYELMSQIIRRHSDRALYLGDRYQSFFYPEVAKAAGEYVDVLSTNFDVHFNDGSAARYYLPTLYELARKPIIIGEYYMSAMENRSGNGNSRSAFPIVQTQEERVRGFLTTATLLARTPYVVGADWFQYFDEPTHGREDGEDFNFGLVDIHGVRYERLTDAARSLDWHGLKRNPVTDIPDVSAGIPPAPENPLAGGDWKTIMRDWDRLHGFVKPSTAAAVADLYLCWSRDTLYAGMFTEDFGYGEYYRTGTVPEEDRTLLSFEAGPRGERVQLRLAADREPTTTDPRVRVLNGSVLHSHRNFTVVRIPSRIFGKVFFSPGDPVRLRATLESAARAYTVKWEVDARIASHDR
jgi:hypothetical protein